MCLVLPYSITPTSSSPRPAPGAGGPASNNPNPGLGLTRPAGRVHKSGRERTPEEGVSASTGWVFGTSVGQPKGCNPPCSPFSAFTFPYLAVLSLFSFFYPLISHLATVSLSPREPPRGPSPGESPIYRLQLQTVLLRGGGRPDDLPSHGPWRIGGV